MKLSEAYTWIAYGLALVAMVLAARAMVPRWKKGWCAGCGYDLTGLAQGACPECGIRRVVRAYRPRWALLGLAILMTAPGLIWWAAREEVRQAYWWLRYPRWKLASERSFGPWMVRELEGGRPDCQFDRLVTVYYGDQELFRSSEAIHAQVRADVREEFPWPGVDITGDGVPEFLFQFSSGGAHCCTTLLVFDASPAPRLLASIPTLHSEASFVDDDGNGIFDIEILDWSWAYWNTSFAGSPAPPVVLTWARGMLAPHPIAMQSQAPTDVDLAQKAARVRESIFSLASE